MKQVPAKRRKRVPIMIGTVLILVSVLPIFLYIREAVIDKNIRSQYDVTYVEPDTQNAALKNATVSISEQAVDDKTLVSLATNNQNIGDPTQYSLTQTGVNRYFSWIGFIEVKNNNTGTNESVIVKRLPGEHPDSIKEQSWEIYTINEKGDVQEEHVTYKDHSTHHKDVYLINRSGAELSTMGYNFDVREQYPSLLVPIVFPILTLIAGFIILIYGLKKKHY